MVNEDLGIFREINGARTYQATLPTGQAQTPFAFTIKSEFKLGAWAHAMACTLDLGTAGSAHGLASAGTSVLIPPNGSLERGALYCHIFEIGAGASSTWGSAGPVGFLKFDSWGTKTNVDDNAYFMDIQGLTEGTGHMFSAGADVAAAATLKIRIGTTEYFLMLATGEST